MSAAFITITAQLAHDPELRTSDKGTEMCTLVLPVRTGWGNNKITTWWRATLFGKRAKVADRHLRKGSWVCVSGPASVYEYDGKDGRRFRPQLTCSEFHFVGPKQDDGGYSSKPASGGSYGGRPPAPGKADAP